MTYQELWKRYCELRKLLGEKNAAKIAIREAPKELTDELWRLVSECTFTRRNYGGGQFYCWANHPKYDMGDPWPASIWPKNSLAMMFVSILKGVA